MSDEIISIKENEALVDMTDKDWNEIYSVITSVTADDDLWQKHMDTATDLLNTFNLETMPTFKNNKRIATLFGFMVIAAMCDGDAWKEYREKMLHLIKYHYDESEGHHHLSRGTDGTTEQTNTKTEYV